MNLRFIAKYMFPLAVIVLPLLKNNLLVMSYACIDFFCVLDPGLFFILTLIILGSGGGRVVKTVAFDTRVPCFESSHW